MGLIPYAGIGQLSRENERLTVQVKIFQLSFIQTVRPANIRMDSYQSTILSIIVYNSDVTNIAWYV